MDVYLASGNPHKFREFAEMLLTARIPVNFYSAEAVDGMPEVEESGETLEENAGLKARALLERVPSGSWVLADDSGLLVDALGGAPGVHSARYAGPAGNAMANNLKLLKALRDVPMERRTARFSCVLCFTGGNGETAWFKGACEGHILEAPAGTEGFGYDPLFRPLGYTRSFAELSSAQKNALSHRARAVAEWLEALGKGTFMD